MEAEEGKRVRISFICKLEDGTSYAIAERNWLEFVVGQGKTLPSLERGVLGMKPGEHRTIRVPGAEIEGFPLDETEARTLPAGAVRTPKLGYDFGPGEGVDDDVYLSIPSAPTKSWRERPAAGADLLFEVELIDVADADQ
jgi:FKBP-type peptidyl-prolyl cis-trans isomerase 2